MKNKFFTILLGICVLCNIEVIAQWIHLNETFDGGNIRSIKTLGNSIFVGTSNFHPKHNKIYKSNDSGNSWILLDSINGHNDGFTQISALGNIIFASDADSGIYRSTDFGNTWDHLIYLPNVHGYPFTIKDSIIILGTDNGKLYQSLDSGTTWLLTDSASLCNYINSLVSDSANILAGTCNGILSSTDGGSNWFIADSGLKSITFIVKVPYIFSAGNIFNVGSGIYRSSDHGIHWTDVTNNLCSTSGSCFGIINNFLLVAIEHYGVYISNDNGQDWKFANSGLGNNNFVSGFDTLGNYVFAATKNGVFRLDTSQIALLPCDSISVLPTATLPSCYICPNGSATIYADTCRYSGIPPYTYIWNTSPVQTTQTITGLSSGTYSFYITDSLGCVGSGSFFLYDSAYIDTLLGVINQFDNLFLSVSPNPSNEYLTISFPKDILNSEIEIFNIVGTLEYSSRATSQKQTFDVSALEDGIHIIQIIVDKKIYRQKFIKQKNIR